MHWTPQRCITLLGRLLQQLIVHHPYCQPLLSAFSISFPTQRLCQSIVHINLRFLSHILIKSESIFQINFPSTSHCPSARTPPNRALRHWTLQFELPQRRMHHIGRFLQQLLVHLVIQIQHVVAGIWSSRFNMLWLATQSIVHINLRFLQLTVSHPDKRIWKHISDSFAAPWCLELSRIWHEVRQCAW